MFLHVSQASGAYPLELSDHMTEASIPRNFPLSTSQTDQHNPSFADQKVRVEWVDFAKGLGIFLVVFGHALGGLINSGVLPAHGGLSFAVGYIYSFHMPLFFLLAGLFVRSSSRKPFRSYLANKVSVIVYPYFLWSLLAGVLQHFASKSNSSVSWLDIAKIPYAPIDQYWFLYVIFCMYILFWFLYRWHISTHSIFLLTIAFYIWEASGGDVTEWDVLHALGAFLIYFGLGAAVAETSLLTALAKSAWPYLLIIAIVDYGLVGAIAITDQLKQPVLHPLAAIAGTFATVVLAMLLSRAGGFVFVRTWGVYSLEIFVAHTIFSAGFRIVMQKSLGYESPWVHIIVGTAIGICLPILLATASKKIGFPYLFTATRTRRHPN
jgi:fucose 4-O-acetylase-like acetyltransferase